jgi:hypothetical protein
MATFSADLNALSRTGGPMGGAMGSARWAFRIKVAYNLRSIRTEVDL